MVLVAVLMFTVPSFGSAINIDFSGSGISGTGLAKSPTTVQGTNLPIQKVVVTNDFGGTLYENDKLAGLLNFTLDKVKSTGTLSLSGIGGLWMSGDFSYTMREKGGYTTVWFEDGDFTLTPTAVSYFKSAGLAVPEDLKVGVASTSLKVTTAGVTMTSTDMMLVPEPLTTALFLPGLAFFGFIRRRFLA